MTIASKTISDALAAYAAKQPAAANMVQLASDARDLVEACVGAGIQYSGQRVHIAGGQVWFEGHLVAAPYTTVRREADVAGVPNAKGERTVKLGALGAPELLTDIFAASDAAELGDLVAALRSKLGL